MWLFDEQRRAERRADAELRTTIGRQLGALGTPHYELVTRTRDDQTHYARVSAQGLLERAPDLRAQNLAGSEVRFRPAERTGLVLLHGLSAEQMTAMARDGFTASLVNQISVSPTRYDAWLRLDTRGLPRGLHDALAQVLAARYGADVGVAGWRQSGLVAGFDTFAARSGEGPAAWRVAVIEAVQDRGGHLVAPAAHALREEVLDHVALSPTYWDVQRAPERTAVPLPSRDEGPAVVQRRAAEGQTGQARPLTLVRPARDPLVTSDYAEEFGGLRQWVLDTRKGSLDERQVDWAAAHHLARRHPALTVEQLAEAMDRGGARGQGQGGLSPERDTYIAQTAQCILEGGERPARPRQHDRDGGRGR